LTDMNAPQVAQVDGRDTSMRAAMLSGLE
jgi:hypothetical protein